MGPSCCPRTLPRLPRCHPVTCALFNPSTKIATPCAAVQARLFVDVFQANIPKHAQAALAASTQSEADKALQSLTQGLQVRSRPRPAACLPCMGPMPLHCKQLTPAMQAGCMQWDVQLVHMLATQVLEKYIQLHGSAKGPFFLGSSYSLAEACSVPCCPLLACMAGAVVTLSCDAQVLTAPFVKTQALVLPHFRKVRASCRFSL